MPLRPRTYRVTRRLQFLFVSTAFLVFYSRQIYEIIIEPARDKYLGDTNKAGVKIRVCML